MCDVGVEAADVCAAYTRKARKQWRCETCHWPIMPGTTYRELRFLGDGTWLVDRVHTECEEIAKYAAFDLCKQHVWTPTTDIPHEIEEHDDAKLRADWAAIVAKYRPAEATP